MIERRTIVSLIESCGSMRQLKQLHALAVVSGLARDVVPLSRLVEFCADPARGADLAYARALLLHLGRAPTTHMHNSLVRALSLGPDPAAALSAYRDMLRSSLAPDHFTFPFALKACARAPAPAFGRCVHARVVATGFGADVYVATALVHTYVSCGDAASARRLFDAAPNRNVVTWTTMIAGYVDNGRPSDAVSLFREMVEAAQVEPNEITMVHALAACAQSRDLDSGRLVHDTIAHLEFDPVGSNVVLATALLDMYAKCGSLRTARVLFDRMPQRNEVSWNALIGVYNQHGRTDDVLRLFGEMRSTGCKPDNVTWLGVLGACGNKGLMALGQGVHAYLEKTNSHKDVNVCTSLMDMYSKTGDACSALRIFHTLNGRDVLAWTSMIIGLAKHGHGKDALKLFKEMEEGGVVPDHITFIGVLTACSHAGMVEEGQMYFNSMRSVYGIKPTVKHYGCVVDLLSRAGHLAEAESLVRAMPIRPSIMIWGSILTGCEIYGEVGMAERIGQSVAELNPQCSGLYVLLSNIYAGAGRWHGVEMTRRLMWQKGLKKTNGSSSSEVKA
ncbi:putative pentatricopeptide repeat-containing protein [Ananas comosus]|uniref:Putative pentatricopeptide repeat-containing protein n=1 Tax=Ananas comosus TaxID=4615 RepID=A0A199V140_ANACO|nr:putative pentatricopeptide repeat-containing protein [Ananas comosus]